MRAHAHQPQRLLIWPLVDEQQIWLQMAFPMFPPITTQQVIAVLLGEVLILSQRADDLAEQLLNISVPGICPDAFVVAPKFIGPFNRPHSDRPSSQQRCALGAYFR